MTKKCNKKHFFQKKISLWQCWVKKVGFVSIFSTLLTFLVNFDAKNGFIDSLWCYRTKCIFKTSMLTLSLMPCTCCTCPNSFHYSKYYRTKCISKTSIPCTCCNLSKGIHQSKYYKYVMKSKNVNILILQCAHVGCSLPIIAIDYRRHTL